MGADDPDPFSHFSANSLKLLDPTADNGDAALIFLGGANGKSFGRSVGTFSTSIFGFSSNGFSPFPFPNRDIFGFVSLFIEEEDEPEEK